MRYFICLKAATVLLLASTAAAAAPAKTVEIRGITWHTSFKDALKAAKGKGRDPGKPVLHLRVLGDLDGFM